MEVRITKASKPTYWYANKVGNIFDVKESGEEDFRVLNEPMFINKSDCVEILDYEIVKKSKDPKFTLDEDKSASTLTHGGERVAPNPKYCIAGEILCENYHIFENRKCLIKGSYQNIAFFEQCPWPSKQKPIEDKYEKAWKIFRKIEWGIRINCDQMKEEFIKALKEAGL